MSDFFEMDTSDLEAKLAAAVEKLPAAKAKVVGAILTEAERKVREFYVPVDTGQLQNGVYSRVEDDGSFGELGVAGVAHAAKQEVDFSLNHPEPGPGGPMGSRGADYIGRGIREAGDTAAEVIAKLPEELFNG
jgi:hypothetical protein